MIGENKALRMTSKLSMESWKIVAKFRQKDENSLKITPRRFREYLTKFVGKFRGIQHKISQKSRYISPTKYFVTTLYKVMVSAPNGSNLYTGLVDKTRILLLRVTNFKEIFLLLWQQNIEIFPLSGLQFHKWGEFQAKQTENILLPRHAREAAGASTICKVSQSSFRSAESDWHQLRQQRLVLVEATAAYVS
jgi:hypothetical protein